jgi:hypothetical protein
MRLWMRFQQNMLAMIEATIGSVACARHYAEHVTFIISLTSYSGPYKISNKYYKWTTQGS